LTKDKDAINELLRKSRLTSIQENGEASSSSSGDEATVRYWGSIQGEWRGQ
jgi:hypothetical protein